MNDVYTLIHTMVRAIVNDASSLIIDETQDERGFLFTISVSSEDMNHLIGKHGETINAIKRIVGIYSVRKDIHCGIRIKEPNI